MGKKYLLYIHSERFADEEKKSGLVNQLLADHYDEQDRPKKIVARTIPKTSIEAPTGVAQDEAGVIKPIKTAADAKKAVAASKSGEVAFCEHGFAPGFCKHAKCKNASRA